MTGSGNLDVLHAERGGPSQSEVQDEQHDQCAEGSEESRAALPLTLYEPAVALIALRRGDRLA